jgi:hypothetical protein
MRIFMVVGLILMAAVAWGDCLIRDAYIRDISLGGPGSVAEEVTSGIDYNGAWAVYTDAWSAYTENWQ